MAKSIAVAQDVHVIPSFFPIPGAGFLPTNSFVITSEEPVLIDTGMGVFSDDFLGHLQSIIDPKEIKWIWLTHDDSDHTGSLEKVMALAPDAKLVTHAFSALRMSTSWAVPLERVYAISPGGHLNLGDRILRAIKPPVFDNPMSVGVYDEKSRVLFSVDSFGGLVPGQGELASDFDEKDLVPGMVAWATFDSPWVHLTRQDKFDKILDDVRQIDPFAILSSHLPPAIGATDSFLKVLASLPSAEPFVPPDQHAFQQILKAITQPESETKSKTDVQ